MKYTDSKDVEHEVSEMGTWHLHHAIKKHKEHLERFNPDLLAEMQRELDSRDDKPIDPEELPKVNVGKLSGSKEDVEDNHDYHQDDFESQFEVDDDF